jgi:hypothetical protein
MQSFACLLKRSSISSLDGDQRQVCRLSLRGDRFIPYPGHYNPAFAFCLILYPLAHQRSLRSACRSCDRRAVGLISFHCCNTTGLDPSALTKIDPFSLTKCAPSDAQRRTWCAVRRAIEKRQALKPTGCFWGGWKRRAVAVSRAGCGFMQPGAASLDTAEGRYA